MALSSTTARRQKKFAWSASAKATKKLVEALTNIIPDCDAIIVCDYAKGVVTAPLMDKLRQLATHHNIPLLLDPRPEHADWYHDVTFITPNRKEAGGMIHASITSLDEAKTHGLALAHKLNTNLLLTMSEAGMMIVDHTTSTTKHLATKAQEVADVSGAGDTVIATFALALATKADALTAATIANHAASVVVAKSGTATVNKEELLATFS
jgi:rfaE bifunctional protein kinase chain/domain